MDFSIKTTIFLDGSNFFQKFYPGLSKKNDPPNHWNLNAPYKKVRRFVRAIRRSGYDLFVFFDAEHMSYETIHKWTKRREADVRKEWNTLPAKAGYLLGMYFRWCKVPVHYSFEADNDDTIAAYAQYYQGVVLSADRDFFRYRNREYDVYSDFIVTSSETIRLIPHKIEKRKTGCGLRDILDYLPETLGENHTKNLIKTSWHQDIRMGCPTQMVKTLGNPYLALRPLRQAIYYKFWIKEKKEYIPFWNEEFDKVEWDITVVNENKKYFNLLKKPFEALEKIFMISKMEKPMNCSYKKWTNHIFSICVLTFDICSMIYDRSEDAFYDMLEEAKYKYQHLLSIENLKNKKEEIHKKTTEIKRRKRRKRKIKDIGKNKK